jgi:hypothetical protein
MDDQNHTQTLPDRGDQLIGQRYRLCARCGRGRLGQIYEAVHEPGGVPGIQRRVAIQLLDEQLVTIPHFADEFERGAAELQAISHPNIVKWLGFGRDGNRYFLVMEFVDSASLRFVLDDVTALPIEEAVSIVRAVGAALQYLHAKARVHGNLKPENVLVTFDYKVKLLDLVPAGWPSLVPGDIEETEPRATAMPDVRDDVYALACLTYELLAGRHPFNANTPLEALRAGLEPMPIDSLSPQRWRAIAGGLALQREHRTPTVAAFLDEFGITGIERLRTIVVGVESSRRAPVSPARWPAAAVPVERYTPQQQESPGSVGAFLLLLVVAGLGMAAFAHQDRLRDEAAGMMLTIDAKLRHPSVAGPGRATGEPAAARPPGAAAPTDDTFAQSPVPQIDDDPSDPPPALATGAGEPASPEPRFRFARPAVTISESQVAARIVIQRSGDTTGPASVVWWTSEKTAIGGEDYADLGRRVEKLARGEQSRTVYVPLLNDTITEPTKSFNIYLGRDYPGRNHLELISGMRVDIIDDD